MFSQYFQVKCSKLLCSVFNRCPKQWPQRSCCKLSDENLMKAFQNCLYKRLQEQDYVPGNKVSIVGCGATGMAVAFGLLTRKITNNLALYDINSKLCRGETLDLMHGSVYLKDCSVEKVECIEGIKESRIVVLTAGARPKHGQTRLDVAQSTADILHKIMPELVKNNPKAVFIIVANPADVMTYVARKSGNLPYEQCISTGCLLDTVRFRLCISKILGVSARSVHGYVLGEHGNSSVPIWSTVTVGGTRLQTIQPTIGTDEDKMNWSVVHQNVVEGAYNVIKDKGYTNWAVGLTVTDVISAIFEDSYRILPLSTNAQGMCGIKDEVFLSLPCIVNKWGIYGIMHLPMTESENCLMRKSAEALQKAQCSVKQHT